MSGDPIVEILKEQFASRKARNTSYSLRSFARDLEMDPSNLSKIIKNKKPVGWKLRQDIAKKLGCYPVDTDLKYEPDIQDEQYEPHNLEVFQVVSSWHHYAILELSKLDGVQLSTTTASEYLGISRDRAASSIKRLKKLGLLSVDNDGVLVCTSESSSSILNQSTSAAHRNQQKEILEKAIEALEAVPFENRSQSSMTMAVDSTRLEEAKKRISRFRRSLGRFLSDGEVLDDVFHLSISLYPVTNSQKGTKE